MLGGHTATQAEAWAQQCTSWGKAPDRAIKVFAIACARLYDEIAREDPRPWKKLFAAAAQDWAKYCSEKHSARCSHAHAGMTGVAGDGKAIICENNNGLQ